MQSTTTTTTTCFSTISSSRKPILGAIAGDIIGSIYECRGNATKNPNFEPLFHPKSGVTDDSVLTVATMEALLNRKDGSDPEEECDDVLTILTREALAAQTGNANSAAARNPYDYATSYRKWGRRHPHAGYSGTFRNWLRCNNAGPYRGWGNGSAMRVSPVAWAFDDRADVLEQAEQSARVTHDHPEGIKGAQATALAVYLARMGSSKDEIRRDIEETFGYDLSTKTIAEIRPDYSFDVSCQGSVPQSIQCFLEGGSVEEAARLAFSLGGDSDTMACIACGIAEAYYGPLDEVIEMEVRKRLPLDMLEVVETFSNQFGCSGSR